MITEVNEGGDHIFGGAGGRMVLKLLAGSSFQSWAHLFLKTSSQCLLYSRGMI